MLADRIPVATIDRMTRERFVAAFGGVFEHSPWVAERAWPSRPFGSAAALHHAMLQAAAQATHEERLALLCAHPELAGREAADGALTRDSGSEQGRLGFTALPRADLERMALLNRTYRAKFGFPAIVALALHAGRDTVFADIERRTANDAQREIDGALEQIAHITRARLRRLVAED